MTAAEMGHRGGKATAARLTAAQRKASSVRANRAKAAKRLARIEQEQAQKATA